MTSAKPSDLFACDVFLEQCCLLGLQSPTLGRRQETAPWCPLLPWRRPCAYCECHCPFNASCHPIFSLISFHVKLATLSSRSGYRLVSSLPKYSPSPLQPRITRTTKTTHQILRIDTELGVLWLNGEHYIITNSRPIAASSWWSAQFCSLQVQAQSTAFREFCQYGQSMAYQLPGASAPCKPWSANAP